MDSSSKTQKTKAKSLEQSKDNEGYENVHRRGNKTHRSKNKNIAEKYFWDSNKVGVAGGKILDYSKYFCSCEELNKLIHKKTPTKTEDRVLEDMAKRWGVCPVFARGQKCYYYNCPKKHSWKIEGNVAFRQAALELRFCKKMCCFCTARPGVSERFAREFDEKTKSWRPKNPGLGKMRMPRKPGTALYEPKALSACDFGTSWIAGKKPRFTAEEFPTLASETAVEPLKPKLAPKFKKPATVPLPKAVEFQVIGSRKAVKPAPQLGSYKTVMSAKPEVAANLVKPAIAQNSSKPPQTSDIPIKLSELPARKLPQPIGAKAAPTKLLQLTESTILSRSETLSEQDPNGYTSESASGTSMAISVEDRLQEPSTMTDRSKEAKVPVAVPGMSDEPTKDTVLMLRQMGDLMQQMMEELKALKTENAELKTWKNDLKAKLQES